MKKIKNKSKNKMVRRIAIPAAVLAAALLGLLIFRHPFSGKTPAVLALSETVEAVPGGLVKNAQTSLSVPTQITKIGEDYFLVDCYHNQILTTRQADAPLTEWYVLTDQINRGHTIAGDGTVLLADDTENNRILIFEKKDEGFCLTQTFSDIGVRPHYVVYDPDSARFYALSSMTGELYVFSRPDSEQPRVALEKILSVPELSNVYVRSFTIDGDDIYFVSGNGNILRTRQKDDGLSVEERFPVPDSIAGMIQLTRIQDRFYITVSTDASGSQDFATILRVQDLNDLAAGDWEDVYASFVGGGTPYYISAFDGHYYLTEHRIPGHSVWQFDVKDNELTDIIPLF
ncbi:MAG: hypothetical protein Q4C65_14030 [Eubacteriales bacterium]|nr:hypothetical protein [Eubacteriales bacterium]